MLIIERGISQRVIVTAPDGTKISIMVTAAERGGIGPDGKRVYRVKLGVDAPSEYAINREPA